MESTENTVSIFMLGGLRAVVAGNVVPLKNRRMAPQLLAYLAFNLDKTCSRETVVDLFWPEEPEDRGRANLNNAVLELRGAFKEYLPASCDLITGDAAAMAIESHTAYTDVGRFLYAQKKARSTSDQAVSTQFLQEAVDIYLEGGEFAQGYYEEWVQTERHNLAELFMESWRQLTRRLEHDGRHEDAILYARRAICLERTREEFHSVVIRLLADLGRYDEALEQAEIIETEVEEELNLKLGADITRLIKETQRLAAEAQSGPVAAAPPRPPVRVVPADEVVKIKLETPRGTVPLSSRFYMVRDADDEVMDAIRDRESIILIKGPRQVGKSSLLARGLAAARADDMAVVSLNLQELNEEQFQSADLLARSIADAVSSQLDLKQIVDRTWDSFAAPNHNLKAVMRRVLDHQAKPLVWALDEADRLISCKFSSDIFGLFRAWSESRVHEPGGPCNLLTLVIAYSTEPHLFISNLDQSPFNVGMRVELDDFSFSQVAELNTRHNSPLQTPDEITGLYGLVGGQPYLVRVSLYELAKARMPFHQFIERANSDEWIFGDHLRRIVSVLKRDPELSTSLKAVLEGQPRSREDHFFRLRSAGIVLGSSPQTARIRCRLYQTHLSRYLA